ncbi:SDR family NAD(P)-dependent oxidoreductase [Amycolatopsis sp. FDAARGOS 1241]|uniref:SDR family NAD(P)-dependent oxidoreductase n=1 Tax=Amycolatopsis sp. FDAARGOS 1241 TaxID=2778070 RepID=UPI00194E95D1|nr:SDR family NAD(P)-dependent oxidoreductase [Amycolatopsis sp. FDAARGOS 1241]QRP47658.1 SDR family NAD(P)-dependent oxidoreductase [Amycolatopsis sp. FDAARGOS 1241]
MTLRDHVALVTGGSGGIGGALVRRLAAEGLKVAVHYSATREAAEAVARETGGVALQADLAVASAAEELVAAVETSLGPVDVLVANHGRSRRRELDREITAADWDETFAVNTRAPFLLTQAVLGGMRERGFGRILYTSSVAGLTGGVVGPDYAASKAALHGLVHHLAPRVAADGVTVNALAPALIERTAMLPGDPGDLAKMIPVGRLGTPEEIADFAFAVLGNGYLTNHVLPVDGGLHPY